MIKKLLIAYLFTISSVMAGLPPTTLKGQSQTTKPTTFNFQVPNKQATITAASTGLIETGNNNELENAGFEHSTVTTGWTISNATSSSSTTRIEGAKSLSLALTGALSLSQSSTINASQKSGVQMVASVFVNSSDVSDLQLCSLKNGAEDKCTVKGGYVQGSGWRQLTVSFLGNSTSNGLKLKSTDTSGTVLVDQAFVGIGSPIVDFVTTTDWEEFTPTFTGFGTVTSVKAFWRRFGDTLEVYGRGTSGAPIGSGATIVFSSLGIVIDTSKVISDATKGQVAGTFTRDAVNGEMYSVGFGSSYTNSVYISMHSQLGGLRDSNGDNVLGLSEKFSFKFAVPIVGWAGKSSKAYVASSSDTDWASYTPTFTGFGTPTNVNFRWKREGSDLLIDGYFTSGTTTATEARISFPNSVVTSSSAPTISVAGFAAFSAAVNNQFLILKEANSSYMTFGIQNASNGSLTKFVGNLLMSNGQTLTFTARIPIQGWTDSGVIVGSFQGYNETPGTSRVETFSVSYGETATAICDGTGLVNTNQCAYLDQIGNAVANVTRVGLGEYTVNTVRNYSKIKCVLIMGNPVTFTTTYIISSTSNTFSFTTTNASTKIDTYGTLLCQGIPQ